MKPEIKVLYITILKFHHSPHEMMELRYSQEAADRVRYEIIILSTIYLSSQDNVLNLPESFSDFVEKCIVLEPNLLREKFFRLIKV